MPYSPSEFENAVLKRSHEVPVLVDFWAPWCGPCKMLGPVIEKLAAEANGAWELVKIDTEENQELAMALDIRSIPAVKLFHQGKVIDEFMGALPETEIRRWLSKALPSPHSDSLAQAQRFMEQNQYAEAAGLLESVVTAEPANLPARALLAKCLLPTTPSRIPELLEPIGLDSEYYDSAGALKCLARLAILAEAPKSLPDAPVRERYLTGAKAIRTGDWSAALEAFITVLEKDRAYDNEGAKAACKAIFQYLGIRHPTSEKYHRAFSSALHA